MEGPSEARDQTEGRGRAQLCRGMFIACRRPQSLGTPAWDLIDWLRQHTVWGDSSYASGHLRHQGTCPQFCVDGVRNHHALIWLSSLLSTPPPPSAQLHRPCSGCWGPWRRS